MSDSEKSGESPKVRCRAASIDISKLTKREFVDRIRSLPEEDALQLLEVHWALVTPKPISPVLIYGRLQPRAPSPEFD